MSWKNYIIASEHAFFASLKSLKVESGIIHSLIFRSLFCILLWTDRRRAVRFPDSFQRQVNLNRTGFASSGFSVAYRRISSLYLSLQSLLLLLMTNCDG
jgi:hypothetical protein